MQISVVGLKGMSGILEVVTKRKFLAYAQE
jgi:hypothetical protein